MSARKGPPPPRIADLVARHRAGEVILTPEEAQPWATCKTSRASWYRAAKEHEFDAFVRRLGHQYRILLWPYLEWLGALPDPQDER